MALLEDWKLVIQTTHGPEGQTLKTDIICGYINRNPDSSDGQIIKMPVATACPMEGPWKFRLGQANKCFAEQNPADVAMAHKFSKGAESGKNADEVIAEIRALQKANEAEKQEPVLAYLP